MKITVAVYVHGASRGGVENLISLLYMDLLTDNRFELLILTPTPINKCEVSIPKGNIYKIVENRPQSIVHVLEKVRPDILYVPRSSSTTHIFFIEALRLIKFPIKYIAGEHVPPNVGSIMFESRLKRNIIFTAADAIHMLNKDYLSTLPLWMQDKAYAISNPIVLSTDLPKKLNHPRKIISAGRLSFEKGFDVLIKAIYIVKNSYPNVQLEIYGDGNQKERLSTMIKLFGLGCNVSILPHTDNLHRNFWSNDIYVCSSYWEGYGMALAEAVCRGVPSIAFESSEGPKAFIADGKNGILIPGIPNERVLADKILKLLLDDSFHSYLSLNALKTFDSNHNQEIYDSWKELFVRLSGKTTSQLKSVGIASANENELIAQYINVKGFPPYGINQPLSYKKSVVSVVKNTKVGQENVTLFRRYRRIRKVILQTYNKMFG